MDGEARVVKITRGRHALYGISDGPGSYLRRWFNSNRLFGDDIRLVGVLPDGRCVISQLFVEGAMPTTLENAQGTVGAWLAAISSLRHGLDES